MRKLSMVLLFAISLIFSGCGNNEMRTEDGHMVIDLPEGQKLVNIATEGSNINCAIRERHTDEQVEEYTVRVYNSMVGGSYRCTIREH